MTLQVERIKEIPTTFADPPTRCPVDHSGDHSENHAVFSQQKTALQIEPAGKPALERTADGVWHVRGYEEAKTILRAEDTKQAGFKAELMDKVGLKMRPPVLYQEGDAHTQQRKLIARYFTPQTTNNKYRQMMETLSDELIGEVKSKKQVDLSKLSMTLAVRVASQVVGLTNSIVPGIDRRLNAFFVGGDMSLRPTPSSIYRFFHRQLAMLQFFYLDVKPAIRARRKERREDVISHLLNQNSSDMEILTECITYGAAGMVTTREFISIAAWHFLEQPVLRQQYLNATQDERYKILHEILRIEPVVGHLQRRATADLTLQSDGQSVTIGKGDLIDIHIHPTNADESLVGDHPLQICPERQLASDRAHPSVISFGDGAHRCPGAYIAIQESDIFLQRLLAVEGLRIVRTPTLGWGEISNGYEFREFILAR